MNHTAVIGAGTMGVQIALLLALHEHDVTLIERDESTRRSALERADAGLARHASRGRISHDAAEAARARIEVHADLDAVAGAGLVIEAITEVRDLKRDLLAGLDRLLEPDALLASNSSSFVPSSLATGIVHKERFLNIHFFNPVLTMRAVEIIGGPDTAVAAVTRATALVESLGKVPVVLKKEIPGFIANRILNAVRDEALRLCEGGYAGIETIDQACRLALGYPMGPFELMDLTGIDIGNATKKARFAETGDPADAPSRTVTRLVQQGTLGRKTRRGFYHYDENLRRGEPAI